MMLPSAAHSSLITHYSLSLPSAMAKTLPQITFEFSDEEAPKEFLSGQPVQP